MKNAKKEKRQEENMAQSSSTSVASAALNKRERKTCVTLIILFLILTLVALSVAVIAQIQAANVKQSAGYTFGLPGYQSQYTQYANYFRLGLVVTVIWAIVALLSVISLVKMKAVNLTVTESGIEGVTGARNGWCLKTKRVTLPYAEITTVESLKSKNQDRYLIITAKDGKKYTFAVENCTELEQQIRQRLGA